MPSHQSSGSLGSRRFSGAVTGDSVNPFLDDSLGGEETVGPDRMPRQEASFRDLPSSNSWSGVAASGYSAVDLQGPPAMQDVITESGGSQARFETHDAQDNQQRESPAAVHMPAEQQSAQEAMQQQQQQEQLPQQLRQQPSGNPFLASPPSPFASFSEEPMGPSWGSGLDAIGSGGVQPEGQFRAPYGQQSDALGRDSVGTMRAESGQQPLPQEALSSTPSLADMLSDLHPAGN